MAGRSKQARQQLQLGERVALRGEAVFDVDSILGAGEGDKRVVPTEFRVFPAGSFTTTKGTFNFTARSAESVMAWYEKRGLRLMGDYEHMTDEPAVGRPPVIAPASITKMIPVIRPNEAGGPELWVTNVQWTARAREMLEQGEYAYFSPTFLHDPETKEVLALLRIALTNDPAIDDLEPLVAASSAAGNGGNTNADGDAQEPTMAEETQKCARCAATDAHLATIQEQHKALKAAHDTLSAGHEQLLSQHKELLASHETMLKSFEDWAAEEAEEHEEEASAKLTAATAGKIIKRLRAFARDVKALAGQKTGAACLGTLTAWKGGAAEAVSLKATAEKAQQEKLASDWKAMADKACSDGKLAPAERKVLEAKGHTFAIEFLTARLGEQTAPIVNRTETKPPAQSTSAALATLTAGEIGMAERVFGAGVSIEALAKAKTDHEAYVRRNTVGAGR